jgi:hypothetical protein
MAEDRIGLAAPDADLRRNRLQIALRTEWQFGIFGGRIGTGRSGIIRGAVNCALKVPRYPLSYRFYWLRGLDLNQRPLGYEGSHELILRDLVRRG